MSSNFSKKVILADPFQDEKYHLFYTKWYSRLCNYCYLLVSNYEASEDIVQDQFVYVWENWERLKKIDSIKGYMIKSIKNRSINYLKTQSKKNIILPIEDSLDSLRNNKSHLVSDLIEYTELEEIIKKAIEHLPNRCRAIFFLKRIDEMSNKEISKQLNISIKTVETQMTIALKRIHKFLSDHWEFVFILSFFCC